MVVGSSLVKETYFMSPEYEDTHGPVRTEERDDGEWCSTNGIKDTKDNFFEWLAKNSHPFTSKTLHRYLGGRLMGENGTFCEIIPVDYHVPEKSGSKFGVPGRYGSYYTLVKISFSPSSRDLSKELSDAFTERNFEEKPEDFQLSNYSWGQGSYEKSSISTFFN